MDAAESLPGDHLGKSIFCRLLFLLVIMYGQNPNDSLPFSRLVFQLVFLYSYEREESRFMCLNMRMENIIFASWY
jgi:hypothetical protein